MTIKHIALIAALGLASSVAAAQTAKNVVTLGAAYIHIDSEAPDLSSNGPAFLTPPASLTIKSASTVVLGYTRHLDDKWAVELVAGIPPAHKVHGTGALAPYGKLAEVKQAGPTVFLNYKFGDAGSAFRPYVGFGVNHTRFFDGESTAANNLAAGGPTKIRLRSSTGLAAQVGVNYKLAPNWSINGSLVVANVEAPLTATTGSIERTTHINFHPTALTVCLGYHF